MIITDEYRPTHPDMQKLIDCIQWYENGNIGERFKDAIASFDVDVLSVVYMAQQRQLRYELELPLGTSSEDEQRLSSQSLWVEAFYVGFKMGADIKENNG